MRYERVVKSRQAVVKNQCENCVRLYFLSSKTDSFCIASCVKSV